MESGSRGSYRWVIVAAGGLLGCIAIGAMFALPVMIAAMAQETGWSRVGISSAMTLAFLALAFASLGWGVLADRVGPRPTVIAGSVLLALGLAAASRAGSLLQFQLAFGLLVGAATAAILTPMMAAVAGWFDTHRSLAVSLVSAGIGVAPLTMSPLAAWLVARSDWRTTFLALAALVALVTLPTTLLVRRPPAPGRRGAAVLAEPAPMSAAQALRSPQLLILLLTNFCCCATHSGPIFHTVSYAVTCGIAPLAAVSIYSLEGLSGMAGRVAFGLAGDRFGAKPVLVAGLLVQACGALVFVAVRELGEFYAAAALFGFAYAGVMPLYAVLARETFPLTLMGTVIGALSMAGSLGMAAGPLFGGWIYDTTTSYVGLYLVSAGIGFGAVAVAATFRPGPPSRPSQPLPQPA